MSAYQVKLNSKYAIEFITDISKPVDAGDAIQFKLLPVVNDVIGTSTITSFDGETSTGTYNQSFSDIVGATFDLGVILTTQQVVQKVDELTGVISNDYTYTEIKADPIIGQFTSVSQSSGIFSIKLLTVTDANAKAIYDYFSPSAVYQVGINLHKLFNSESISTFHYVNFIVAPDTVSLTKDYNTVPCNVITTFNKLEELKSINNIIDNGQMLNYKFTPTTVNSDKKIVKEVDSNNNPIELNFDVAGMVENLFIKQYLSEYVNYFDAIQHNSVDVAALIKDIKKLLLNNSNLINASVKGNINGMSAIFNMFCRATGYQLLSLEPSPVLHNFTYRISTSLPIEYWNSDIKDIIHPYSWSLEYNYVNIVSDKENFYFDYNADMRRIALKEHATSYLDISNKQKYFNYPAVFDLSSVDDYHTASKFNFDPHEYIMDRPKDESNRFLNPFTAIEQYFFDSFKVDYTENAGVLTVTPNFTYGGVALKYKYEVFVGASPIPEWTFEVPHPSFTFKVDKQAGVDYTMHLTLINDEMDDGAGHPYTSPIMSIKFIDV